MTVTVTVVAKGATVIEIDRSWAAVSHAASLGSLLERKNVIVEMVSISTLAFLQGRFL